MTIIRETSARHQGTPQFPGCTYKNPQACALAGVTVAQIKSLRAKAEQVESLREAAQEAVDAMSSQVPSPVAVQHASVEWKRIYEAYHKLRSAIARAALNPKAAVGGDE